MELTRKKIASIKDHIDKYEKGYYIVAQEVNDGDLEILMGRSKFLLEYSIDVKENTATFVTSRIIKDESDYGRYKQILVSDLTFKIDDAGNAYFILKPALVGQSVEHKPMHHFPFDYISKLESIFNVI